MQKIYISLITLLILSSTIIAGNNENKNRIEYLLYQVSEQNEKILYLSNRIIDLDEELFKLKEHQNEYMSRKDIISLFEKLKKLPINLKKKYKKDMKEKFKKSKDNSTKESIFLNDSLLQEQVEHIDNHKDIYDKALSLFQKEKYNLSKIYFKKSINNNYNKTSSLFNLGEIHFYQQLYKESFLYYKQSIKSSKNSNTMSYVPEDTLYLHIGISLYKLNKIDKANNFFKYVIEEFPKSESAREAYIILNK